MQQAVPATDITADAIALQELDEFRAQGWVKLIAPAKVNLHLAIGERRDDGYHDAATVMHTLNLHDVVYMRRKPGDGEGPEAYMVARGDIAIPEISSEDNIACKAVRALAAKVGRLDDLALEIRIEKNGPAQAGLGGGSSDAAAALVGAAQLWGLAPGDPAIEQAACEIGADVAFFLHGGCAYLEGTGGTFGRGLAPSKRSVALVKPDGGVSTGAAYRTFDEDPQLVSPDIAAQVANADIADEVPLFNNLAAASETLMPQLAEIRTWLEELPGVEGALLCGSGSCTFAVCDSFASACQVVAQARQRGLWARTTSFGSSRVLTVGT
ncbi:MAG: 4-(cytidine 5'-diphospho)-2-C-methyl-D-erythritol kinase [Eggerthellaceae bacterium]|nr:4-(cytidine 5'-diphospho)-2-C-methyl-D-erythritol kinase [Eggerthellaceae bacterium]